MEVYPLPSDPPATIRLADETATVSLPIQPIPRSALVQEIPGGQWTALARHWPPGGAARCRLCPSGSCIAVDDACLLVVPGRVEDDDALMYSSLGLDRVLGDD